MHFKGQRIVVVVVVALAAGALPATASAGTARLESSLDDRSSTTTDALIYTAAPGEQNRLTVRAQGQAAFSVTDSAGITPGRGCSRIGQDPTRVRCQRINDQLGTGRLELGDGNDTASADTDDLTPPDFYGGAGNDVLTGDPERTNLFVGGRGNDRMVGGTSIDVFDEGSGPSGSDTMLGGGTANDSPERGNDDSVSYRDRRGRVFANLDGRRNDGARGERDQIGGDVETIVGGRGRDRLRGNGRANSLIGGVGLDVLNGAGGNDSLEGGRSADRINGGRGRDDIFGGSGADRISARDGARDTINCGSGTDRLRADRRDRRRRCERVKLR